MIKIDFSKQEINQLNYRRQKLLFRLSLTLCLVSFVLGILMVYSYRREKYQTVKKVHEQAKLTAKNAAVEIDKRLIKLETIVKSLENELSVRKFNEEQFGKKLKEISHTNPEIWTVGVVYKPFEFNPSLRLYSTLYGNKDGKFQFLQIEDSYDYTQHEWYKQPLTKGENWLEPFFGDATKALITGFAIPFYRPDDSNHKLGIVIATINLQEIREIVSSLKLGKTGFGFLLSKKGTFISYPHEKYVTEQKTIFDLVKEFNNNEELRKIGEKAIKGVSGNTIDFIEINEQKVLIFYEPIPSTCSSFKGKKRCWSLGVTFFKDEFFVLSEDTEISKKGDIKSLRRKLIWSSLATVLFLFFLSILIFGAYQGSVRNLWTVSSWFSVLLGVEIGFIIYLSLTEQGQQLGGTNQVLLRVPVQS